MNILEALPKDKCSGCGLCSEICPKKCISMLPNAEGFLYPRLKVDECVHCGICVKKCPQMINLKHASTLCYVSTACDDEQDLLKSSSGGVFITMAKRVLEHGGVVCGCVYDSTMTAKHVCTQDLNVVYKMCGSKYVQSKSYSCFKEIKNYLKQNIQVLFTGTACQVAALRSYLFEKEKCNEKKLLTVDILCHGVPSPLYFQKYVEHCNRKYKGIVYNIEFRNKELRGWGSEHRTCIYLHDKKGNIKKIRPFLPAYFCAFFWGVNLRDSCYQCIYAGCDRVSDLTIGDYWGYWKHYGKKFPKGISICSINTEPGRIFFESLKNHMAFVDEIEASEAKGSNTNFYNPTIKPQSRAFFYKDIQNLNYESMWARVFLDKCTRKKKLVSLYGAFVPSWIAKLIRFVRECVTL